MKRISEEEFYNTYDLLDNHLPYEGTSSFDGKMFETYGQELEFVTEMAKQNRVITIIEIDSDPNFDYDQAIENGDELPLDMIFVTGMHLVNRIGYLITQYPLMEEFEVILD